MFISAYDLVFEYGLKAYRSQRTVQRPLAGRASLRDAVTARLSAAVPCSGDVSWLTAAVAWRCLAHATCWESQPEGISLGALPHFTGF